MNKGRDKQGRKRKGWGQRKERRREAWEGRGREEREEKVIDRRREEKSLKVSQIFKQACDARGEGNANIKEEDCALVTWGWTLRVMPKNVV